jgi:hypothetical protein
VPVGCNDFVGDGGGGGISNGDSIEDGVGGHPLDQTSPLQSPGPYPFNSLAVDTGGGKSFGGSGGVALSPGGSVGGSHFFPSPSPVMVGKDASRLTFNAMQTVWSDEYDKGLIQSKLGEVDKNMLENIAYAEKRNRFQEFEGLYEALYSQQKSPTQKQQVEAQDLRDKRKEQLEGLRLRAVAEEEDVKEGEAAKVETEEENKNKNKNKNSATTAAKQRVLLSTTTDENRPTEEEEEEEEAEATPPHDSGSDTSPRTTTAKSASLKLQGKKPVLLVVEDTPPVLKLDSSVYDHSATVKLFQGNRHLLFEMLASFDRLCTNRVMPKIAKIVKERDVVVLEQEALFLSEASSCIVAPNLKRLADQIVEECKDNAEDFSEWGPGDLCEQLVAQLEQLLENIHAIYEKEFEEG